MRGEIDFRASLTHRVALLRGLDTMRFCAWTRSGCGSPQVRSACSRDLRAPAPGRCSYPEASRSLPNGLKPGSVSITRLPARWRSRTALTGRIAGEIVDGPAKAQAFARLACEFAGDGGLTLAIGDGANDIPMLRRADIGVAYHAKPVVREEATYTIDRYGLDAGLNLFG